MKRAAFVLAVAVAGCGGDAGRESVPGLLTRSEEPNQAEMSAIMRGTLELDLDRGCVLLSGKPVVWPAGTTLSEDPPLLRFPNGAEAAPGDLVTGGGGEIPADRLGDTTMSFEGDVQAARDCAPAAEEVVVFTARGDDIAVRPPR